MDRDKDGMLDGRKLGVLLGTTDGLVLGTDEGIIISSTDGEVLGSTLRALDDFTLGLNEGTGWVLQMAPLMVLMK